MLREALDLARHYLSSHAQPGNVIALLRETKSRLAAPEGATITLGRDDLLITLSQLTGLPRSVLDEREGLDPAGLRDIFQQRVMGQPEAVTCLVDRVAMLKAGLTDPASSDRRVSVRRSRPAPARPKLRRRSPNSCSGRKIA